MAAATQPSHVVDLIGAKPDGPEASCRWTERAGRIEAYREEWGVEPSHLWERPRDHVQAREWDVSILALRVLAGQLQRNLGRGIEVGIGVEL